MARSRWACARFRRLSSDECPRCCRGHSALGRQVVDHVEHFLNDHSAAIAAGNSEEFTCQSSVTDSMLDFVLVSGLLRRLPRYFSSMPRLRRQRSRSAAERYFLALSMHISRDFALDQLMVSKFFVGVGFHVDRSTTPLMDCSKPIGRWIGKARLLRRAWMVSSDL